MGITFGGMPCVDPKQLLEECYAKGIPPDVWRGRANYFACSLGRNPGRGAILLIKRDLDQLALFDSHTLSFNDGSTIQDVQFVTITRFQCAIPGAELDPNAVYLVELADYRLFFARSVIDKAYNMRSSTSGGYLPQTLNAMTPWTWAEMVEDIWNSVGLLGTFPGLPFVPEGHPESFDFYGGNAWTALNDVVERLGCAVHYDPIEDSIGIVQLGTNTFAADNALARLLIRDRIWQTYGGDPTRSWRPQYVRVLFRILPIPAEGSSPWHVEDILTEPAIGMVPGTYVILYDDLASNGANDAEILLRATERAADWERIRVSYVSPLVISIAGVFDSLPDTLGPFVETWCIRDLGTSGLQSEVSAAGTNPVERFRPPEPPIPSFTYGTPIPFSSVTFYVDLNPRCSAGMIVFDRTWITHTIAGGVLVQIYSDTDPDAPVMESQWWCTEEGCIESVDPPESYLDGPFATEEECTTACT